MFESIRIISRLPAIVGLAGLVTVSLFYAMQLLIMTNESIPEPGERLRFGNITMPAFDFIVNRSTPLPEELLEPPMIPLEIRLHPIAVSPVQGIGLQAAVAGAQEIGEFELLGPADGNAVPIARMEPDYPARAAARGIEGYAIVEFDVNENGSVINPRILGAEPANIFDRASLRAIERWKYNPRIVNGEAVKMLGLKTRFSFSLEE